MRELEMVEVSTADLETARRWAARIHAPEDDYSSDTTTVTKGSLEILCRRAKGAMDDQHANPEEYAAILRLVHSIDPNLAKTF